MLTPIVIEVPSRRTTATARSAASAGSAKAKI
jgi:hypothetical protein